MSVNAIASDIDWTKKLPTDVVIGTEELGFNEVKISVELIDKMLQDIYSEANVIRVIFSDSNEEMVYITKNLYYSCTLYSPYDYKSKFDFRVNYHTKELTITYIDSFRFKEVKTIKYGTFADKSFTSSIPKRFLPVWTEMCLPIIKAFAILN